MKLESVRHTIERQVLTGMMADWRAMEMGRTELSVATFKAPANRVLFECMARCFENQGEKKMGDEPEAGLLVIELQQSRSKYNTNSEEQNDFEFVGGQMLIMQITSEKVDLTAFQTKLAKLKDLAGDDIFDQLLKELKADRDNGVPSRLLIPKTIAFGDISVDIGEDPVVIAGSGEYKPGAYDGIPTPFPRINAASKCHGWPLGQTSVIQADTGSFKTTTGVQSAIKAAETHKVCYISVGDMDEQRLVAKMMKQTCGISERPEGDEEKALWWDGKRDELYGLRIRVIDAFTRKKKRYQQIELLIQRLDRMVREEGVQLFIFDYFQKLRTSYKTSNPVEKQAHIATQIEDFTERNRVASVILSQMTFKDGGEMTKGGRDIEHDSSLTIKTEKIVEEPDMAIVTLKKNRYGPSGLRWKHEYLESNEIINGLYVVQEQRK